jgi:hypothetical protein
MSDRGKVYPKVKEMLKLDHPGQVVTWAMMLCGIVLSRTAQLSRLSSELPTSKREKHGNAAEALGQSRSGCGSRVDVFCSSNSRSLIAAFALVLMVAGWYQYFQMAAK